MVTALFAGQVPTAEDLMDLVIGFGGYGQRTVTSTGSGTSTAVGVLRIDGVVGRQGRGIIVGYTAHPDSTVGADSVKCEVMASTSGAATTASTVVPNSRTFDVIAGARFWFTVLIPPADATYSFLLSFNRNSGSGTATLFCDSVRFIELFALQLGAVADTGVDQ